MLKDCCQWEGDTKKMLTRTYTKFIFSILIILKQKLNSEIQVQLILCGLEH